MGERERATSRAHRDVSGIVAPARVLANFTRLLHDAEVLMDRYTTTTNEGPLDSESFAMGVIYAALFLYGNRSDIPTAYVAEMIRAGAFK